MVEKIPVKIRTVKLPYNKSLAISNYDELWNYVDGILSNQFNFTVVIIDKNTPSIIIAWKKNGYSYGHVIHDYMAVDNAFERYRTFYDVGDEYDEYDKIAILADYINGNGHEGVEIYELAGNTLRYIATKFILRILPTMPPIRPPPLFV